jgi:hypothetical protein
MRAMPLALAGLFLAVAPVPAAEAQDRGRWSARPAGAAGVAAAAPMRGRVVVSRDRRAATAAAAAACPRGGRGGAARCGPRAVVAWMHGLSPAAGVQAAGCPAGTTATLATGHADVVRCVPT